MKRIVLLALAALACCSMLRADTDENGMTPTYWYKFDGNNSPSGSDSFSFDGGYNDQNYVETFLGQAYVCNPYPWCSGLNRGSGDFTVVTGAQTVNLDGGMLWGMGTKTSATGFALVTRGADKVALRIFGSSWSSSGEDIITATVPDATTSYHVYTLVYVDNTRICTLYVDGTPAGSASRQLSACTETNFQFGSLHGGTGYSMNGGDGVRLDDFRVYREALTAQQIANFNGSFFQPPSFATISADTNWSEIDWQPVPVKPAFAELHLTVENGAKLVFDTTPVFKSLTVSGNCTLSESGIVPNDVASLAVAGAPYSHWLVHGNVTGNFVYDPAVTFPAGYTTEMETVPGYGVRLVVTAPEIARFGSISINFKENDSQAVSSSDDFHGAFKVQGTAWNDLNAANALTAVSRYVDSEGTVHLNGAMAVNISQVANGWRRTTAVGDTILTGYLDDSQKPRIEVSNIPFARYRIIAYRSTDGGASFGAFKLGTSSADAKFYYGAPAGSTTRAYTLSGDVGVAWGSGNGLGSLAEGVNYVVSDVLSGGSAFVDSPHFPSGSRCSVPAFQIVEVGQIAELPVEYTATISAAGTQTLSTQSWSPSPFNPTKKDRLVLTIDPAVEGEVLLNLDSAAMRIQEIAVVSTGAATLRIAGSQPTSIDQWDFSQVQGQVAFDFVPSLGTIVRGASPRIVINAPYTGEIKSGFEYRGTGNVLTTPLSVKSGMDVVIGGSGTFTGPNVDNEFHGGSSVVWDGTYTHVGNAYLGITDGTLTIAPDAHVTVPHIRTVNSGNTANVGTLNIAGTVVVDTECDANCYSVRNDIKGILLGHWQGTAALNVTGALVGTDTWMEAVFSVASSSVDIDGGFVQVRGISLADRTDNAATIVVRNGGTLQLAEGLSHPERGTWTFDGGTLKAYSYNGSTGFTFDPATTTFTGDCVIDPNGQRIVMSGAIVGSGTITVRDSSPGADGSVVFDDSLDGYNGTIHFVNGTYDLGGVRQLPAKITLGAGVAIAATQTRREYGSGESIVIAGMPDGATVTLNKFDGGTEVATVENGTITFANADPRIDGMACFIDVTFTNLWDMTHREDGYITYKAVPGASLRYDTEPTFVNADENEHDISERGVYIRHHPFIEGMGKQMNALSTFTAVVVGQMSPSATTTFIHFGSSRDGYPGLLIATTDVKDEVVVARTSGNTLVPIKTLSVPNSATARHVYIVTKYDVPATETTAAHSVFDVYLDGVKRATVPMDGIFTLGKTDHCGLQVGSDFGGTFKNSGNCRAVDDNETEVGYINVLRMYDYALTADQVTMFTTQYPYVPEGGLFTRSFTGEEAFNAASTWTKSGEGTLFDEPTGTEEFDPSATLEATAASTIAVNTSGEIETLTLNGAAMSFVRDETGNHSLDVTGASIVNTDVTIAYGALNLGNAPVMLGAHGSLTFDFAGAGLDFSTVYTTTDIQLTGLTDESDNVHVVNVPTALYRTAALVYAGGQYVLRVTPNHEAGDRVYLPGGTVAYTDGTIVKTADDEDTVAFPGDILVMRESGTVQLNNTRSRLDHLEVDAADATVRLIPGEDGSIFGGERLCLLDGTLLFASESGAASLGTATLELEGGTLGAEADLVLDGTLAITAETDQTVFAPVGENPITASGTGAIVKSGAGKLTLGCRLPGTGADDAHPLSIASGSVVLAQSGTVGELSGTGTLEIPAEVAIAATDAISVTNVTLVGAGTLQITQLVQLTLDGEVWTGTVEFRGDYGDTPTDVYLGYFNSLPKPVRITGISGTHIWMHSYDMPSLELAGTMAFNDYNFNATYSYKTITGQGEFQFITCESKRGQGGATISIQNLVGQDIVLTATDELRISIMQMQVDVLPPVNHRLLASPTSDNIAIAAVKAGEAPAAYVPLQVREDGLYVTLLEAAIQVRIGDDVYASAQDAIDAVTAAGKTLLQVEAYIIPDAEIPHGYYRKSDGRLLPLEPTLLIFR